MTQHRRWAIAKAQAMWALERDTRVAWLRPAREWHGFVLPSSEWHGFVLPASGMASSCMLLNNRCCLEDLILYNLPSAAGGKPFDDMYVACCVPCAACRVLCAVCGVPCAVGCVPCANYQLLVSGASRSLAAVSIDILQIQGGSAAGCRATIAKRAT